MEVKLFDFNVVQKINSSSESDNDSDDNKGGYGGGTPTFQIQMFGIDTSRTTYCILVNGFKPYFYAKVSDSWTQKTKEAFVEWLVTAISPAYGAGKKKVACKLIKKRKLYGFDGGKEHKFNLT